MPSEPTSASPPPRNHLRKVQDYYDVTGTTGSIYSRAWHPDHLHFGLFEPGECPAEGNPRPTAKIFTRALERMIEAIVAPIRIKADEHVVDAGCGVGGTALHLAKTFGCTVTGVNITESQLRMARDKARDAGLSDRVNFEWANCSSRLPFADASVDAVVNIESSAYYYDRDRFMREVCRILKPGGRIAASDAMTCDNLSEQKYAQYIAPVCETWAAHSLWSQAEYTWHLQDAGLEVSEFEGFHGKDEANLRILEYYRNILILLDFGGDIANPLHTLCPAWRNGYFVLKRYCAAKPEA